MKDQYQAKIWYYPYVENDIGNQHHMEMITWLREQFNGDDKKLWDIDWIKSEHDILRCKPENLYLYFKSSEMAMAFKLRWM